MFKSKYLLTNYNILQTIMEALIEHSKTSMLINFLVFVFRNYKYFVKR